MSILAIMYMVATPLLAKRYSEKGRYYAWLIIIIGLIIPFRPQWGNVLVNVEVPTHTVTTSEQLGGGTLPIITNSTVSLPIGDTAVNNPFFSISWWNVGFAVWLIGAILFATYQIVKHYHFTKTTNRWSENITDERTLSALESLKSEMGIIKPVSIYLCSCISSPMLIGIIKPKILMPTINLAKDELRFILKHELVHYKRKDLLYKLLVLLTTAIHWFNPIVYLSVRAINVLCETSCDSEVVNSTDTDTRQMYSETIIGVVKYQSKLKTALSTNFYGGKKGMKNRISSIMDIRKKRFGFLVISIIIVATLCAGFVFASDGNGATVNTIPSGVPNFVMPFDTMLPTDDTMSSNARIENRPNVSYTPIRTIDAWIDAQLVAYQEFAEKTLVDYHEFAEKTIEENRIWAEAQVTASGNSPEKREWADEWIASRYEWAEEWIAGRHEWSKEWIAERYEWATEMRDLYDKGLITIIRDENGNIVRLEIVE